MPQSERVVKAYALSDTRLRCVFPQGVCLHTGLIEEVKAEVTPVEVLAPPGASDEMLTICQQLGNMCSDLEEVFIRSRRFLTVGVMLPNMLDIALFHVTMASRAHDFGMNFDRNAYRATVA